jgi:hypothetical protein
MTTPTEFCNKMQEIVDSEGDTEQLHCDLDDYLCRVLIELGYGDGISIFNKQSLWYA